MATTYTARDITVLEGLEPVRKRPGMYIGGVDARGLHHLVNEIVDNAIDEVINGYATRLEVTLFENSSCWTPPNPFTISGFRRATVWKR